VQSKKTWNEVCDDAFLKRRLMKYPGIEKYAKLGESWRQFYLRVTYYTSKMKEDYNFDYISGDFKLQYELLKDYKFSRYQLLKKASEYGELELVKYALKRGADIHATNDYSIIHAVDRGNFDVVKYLVENGADINARNNLPLKYAVENGYLNITKYIVEHGGIITPEILRYAEEYPEILNFLIEN
jgi:hypothetical protein